jgi:hypothetical protein
VTSKDLNASLAEEMLGRWYERDSAGEASHDWEVLPIVTLEYRAGVALRRRAARQPSWPAGDRPAGVAP